MKDPERSRERRGSSSVPGDRDASGRGHVPEAASPGDDRGAPSIGSASDPLDAFVLEAVEFAGILAEESLVPYVRLRGPSGTRGRTSVMIELLDPALLASFHRLGLLRRCPTFRCWTVERRWSEAFGDLELDEQMCVRVARHLAETFRGRLRTRVISLIDRS